jgi:hypothetical protein
MRATPKKLKNGRWGATVHGAVQAGDTVTITTRAGKSWEARVDRVLWTDGAVSICATTGSDRNSGRQGGECNCGGSDDLMSMGYGHMAGQRIRCPECGGWTDVC